MLSTSFLTLLAAGYGAFAQTPTDPNRSSETTSATVTPPKEPGTSFFCRAADSSSLSNSAGICGAVGAKFNIFSGCCIDTAASGTETSYTKGCSDNGGSVLKLNVGSCDLAG
ncbi:hypothetical protein KVR01_013538 [Diaporthe batatas]|uniref:uncharacterized protein n=1 Tax=Diaporthe batatas TaxID=748121 RepID=UPI001D0473D1|nr:uncharacterized protein KVR01_013538 [Diaporthe batatas]KAG8156587.1 hypothetical protein KVR01_013538 [Diaporthe batatas]